MGLEIVTKDDLEIFRRQLLNDIRELLAPIKQNSENKPEGFKTSHVRKILGCSINKLVSLRTSGKIRVKKIGGTLYYNREDIKRLLEEGY
jgi:hypothetical protein